MRAYVNQSAFETALNIVWKNMGSNTTLPILQGIYIKADQGMLELQTNNLVISIKHLIPANVEEPGEAVVSGRMLTNIVKNLKDAAICLEGGDRELHLTCEKSSYRLTALNPHDWDSARFPEYDLEKSIELPTKELSRMVDKVYRVVSKDNVRKILQGIYLTVADNTIRLVATDSFRLAVCDSHIESGDTAFDAVLPGQTFHDVLAMPTLGETIHIGLSDSQIVFSFGDTHLVARRFEGAFPNYKQLLPTSCKTSLMLDVNEFHGALKRVSTIVSKNPTVRFDIDGESNQIKLATSEPEQGEASEYLSTEIQGNSLKIAMNYNYVFDCLNAASDFNELRMELNESMQPVVMKANGEINYLYLLMPVQY